MELTIKLKGTRAAILHNGRLSNPIDPYTKHLKSLTGKKKKTDDDLIEIMQAEARGGAYETPDGNLGMPTANVYGSIFVSAKAFKLGKRIKLALRYEENIEPLLVKGKKVNVDKFLSDPKNTDFRAVRVQSSRLMRSRPIVRDWETTHFFTLDEKMMDKRELIPVLQHAGEVGVCDMRPTYGTFKVEVM